MGLQNWHYGLIGILAFLSLLEALPRLGVWDARYFPPASEITAALWERLFTGEFWTALGQTLTTWGLGLLIAFTAGSILGIIIGLSKGLRAVTSSSIEFLRPIPSVALLPLAVLVLGTGMESTLFLAVYAAFWQVLIQMIYGIQDMDPVIDDTARTFRMSHKRRISTIIWPTTLPYAFTGFRLAATVALTLTVTGELIIGTPGIGQQIAIAQSSGAVVAMFALVAVTGFLGVGVNLAVRRLESWMLFWHPSVRGEATL